MIYIEKNRRRDTMAPPTRACDDDVYNLSDAGSGAKDGTFFLISSLSLSLFLPFFVYTLLDKRWKLAVFREWLTLSLRAAAPMCVVYRCFSLYIINCRAPVVIDTCVTDEGGGVERVKPVSAFCDLWTLACTHTHCILRPAVSYIYTKHASPLS